MKAHHGLSEKTVQRICSVFAAFAQVQKAVLYGSRAKGNYRNGSDIDLTLFGEQLDHSVMTSIDNELDDLLLPYHIDLSVFDQLTHPELIDHIRRVGKVLYERTPASPVLSPMTE